MKTSIVDLRYKMKDVLNALNHRERVSILYHGHVKGVIIPAQEKSQGKVQDHPFFGISRRSKKSVDKQMQELRKVRYHAL